MIGESSITEPQRKALLKLIPEEGIFLEIGTADGVTAAWLAANRPKARVVSLDTFPDAESGVQGIHGNFENWRANRRRNQTLWVGTARQFAEIAWPGTFDVVLIDGEHTLSSCRADLEAAIVLVDPAGAIVLHDFEHRRNGVKPAYMAAAHDAWAVARVVGSMVVLRKRNGDVEQRLKELGYA